MTRPTYTVTAAGLLDVQGEERQALLLESDFTDAIKAGAKLIFQEVVILPVDEVDEMERLTAEVERLRNALEELDFLRHEGGPQSVAAIESSLRAMLELHIAHHNHPAHAAARAALGEST